MFYFPSQITSSKFSVINVNIRPPCIELNSNFNYLYRNSIKCMYIRSIQLHQRCGILLDYYRMPIKCRTEILKWSKSYITYACCTCTRIHIRPLSETNIHTRPQGNTQYTQKKDCLWKTKTIMKFQIFTYKINSCKSTKEHHQSYEEIFFVVCFCPHKKRWSRLFFYCGRKPQNIITAYRKYQKFFYNFWVEKIKIVNIAYNVCCVQCFFFHLIKWIKLDFFHVRIKNMYIMENLVELLLSYEFRCFNKLKLYLYLSNIV